jgi:DNA-binding MarR family transcriptional regulator
MARKISSQSVETAGQIHSAAIHLLRKLRREDDASGLSAPRLSALSVIVFSGPIALGDLAAAEQVRPPTMTRIVDALAAQALITRIRNPQDRRSVQIAATRSGRTLLHAGRERRVHALAAQIALLSAREQKLLRDAADTLKKLIASI